MSTNDINQFNKKLSCKSSGNTAAGCRSKALSNLCSATSSFIMSITRLVHNALNVSTSNTNIRAYGKHPRRSGADEELLYPKRISQRMFTSSLTMAIPVILGFLWWECYFASFYKLLVVLTSLNFWRRPTNGLRRDLDIFATWSSVVVIFLYGRLYTDFAMGVIHFCIILSALMLYGGGKWAQSRGLHDVDSMFHCSLHVWTAFWYSYLFHEIHVQRGSP